MGSRLPEGGVAMTAPPTLFSESDYAALAAIVFRPDYPGFATARGVVEAPGGNPAARDTGKKYAHISDKYLDALPHGWNNDAVKVLDEYMYQAFIRACQVAEALHVPSAFWPRLEFGALRVLEYPPGAGSHVHTDFDLFTVNCWRDQHDKLIGQYSTDPKHVVPDRVHIGELGELLGLAPATPHWVLPSETPQYSIVYFAIPDHAAVLPGHEGAPGPTVGDWLAERLARSRYEAAR
jgi:hypothetical protein